MPGQPPHRTPLRRVSQGSLFALSRSGAYPDAPHGLGFLEPAMTEFIDETEALQANVENLKQLSDSLTTFNESFATWLYLMDMHSLTTYWPQVRLRVAISRVLTPSVGAERRVVQACTAQGRGKCAGHYCGGGRGSKTGHRGGEFGSTRD